MGLAQSKKLIKNISKNIIKPNDDSVNNIKLNDLFIINKTINIKSIY